MLQSRESQRVRYNWATVLTDLQKKNKQEKDLQCGFLKHETQSSPRDHKVAFSWLCLVLIPVFLCVRFRTQPVWDTCLSWVRTLISAWAPSKLMKRDYSPESLSTVSFQGVMMLYLSSTLNLLRRKAVHNIKTFFSPYVRHNHHFFVIVSCSENCPTSQASAMGSL